MHALRAVVMALLLAPPTASFAIPSITASPSALFNGTPGVAIDLFFNVFPGDRVTTGSAVLVATGGTTFESSTNFSVAGAETVGGINRSSDPAEADWVFGEFSLTQTLAPGAYQFATVTVNAGSASDDIVLETGFFVQTPFCFGRVSNHGAILVDIQPAADTDGDGIPDPVDNCPDDFNPTQSDGDGDGLGDACDPFPDDPENDLRQCLIDLEQCLSTNPPNDADGDGELNASDLCPGTPASTAVDTAGCSLEQFCGRITFERKVGRAMATCNALDWKNDEPLGHSMDCQVRMLRGGLRVCEPR